MAHRALKAHTSPGLMAHRALKAHTFPEAYGADPVTEGPKPSPEKRQLQISSYCATYHYGTDCGGPLD
jgi:hypothetical protein